MSVTPTPSTTSTTQTSPASHPGAVNVRSALTAGAVAGSLSVATNLVISLLARGPLDVSEDFVPLTPGPIVLWTLIGAVVGALGWRLIVNRSTRSGAVLRRLVPTVLAISLLPDVALLVTDSMPGTSTAGVLALMLMHVATAAIAVATYRRTMPPA